MNPNRHRALWKKIPIEAAVENLNEEWLEKVSQVLLDDPNQLPFAGIGNLFKNDRLIIDLEFYAIATDISFKNQIEISKLFNKNNRYFIRFF